MYLRDQFYLDKNNNQTGQLQLKDQNIPVTQTRAFVEGLYHVWVGKKVEECKPQSTGDKQPVLKTPDGYPMSEWHLLFWILPFQTFVNNSNNNKNFLIQNSFNHITFIKQLKLYLMLIFNLKSKTSHISLANIFSNFKNLNSDMSTSCTPYIKCCKKKHKGLVSYV